MSATEMLQDMVKAYLGLSWRLLPITQAVVRADATVKGAVFVHMVACEKAASCPAGKRPASSWARVRW